MRLTTPLSVALLCLAITACRGTRITDDGGGGAPAGSPAGYTTPSGSGSGVVSLTGADLAPVDQYLAAKNSQWIVGDDVEIVASREYFATALTLNAPWTGIVGKKTEVVGDEEITTMTFRAPKAQANVMDNPRAMIGTGLTVTARSTLRLRLQKTRSAENPVRLQVSARGDASRGIREKVLQRSPLITLSLNLRQRRGAYAFEAVGGSR